MVEGFTTTNEIGAYHH